MNVGDTFYDQITRVDYHLSILVAHASADRILAFNLTDRRNVKDDSCLIDVGEHEYVTKPSAIDYYHAELYDPKRLDEHVRRGLLKLYPPVLPALLERIRQGALRSPKTTSDHAEILRAAGVRSDRVVMKRKRYPRSL